MKNHNLAIFLSVLWTGLGHLYAGSFLRGLLLMAATPVIWTFAFIFGPGAIYRSMTGAQNAGAVGVLGVVFTLVPFAFWVWGIIDAKKRCHQHNQELRAFVLDGTAQAKPAV